MVVGDDNIGIAYVITVCIVFLTPEQEHETRVTLVFTVGMNHPHISPPLPGERARFRTPWPCPSPTSDRRSVHRVLGIVSARVQYRKRALQCRFLFFRPNFHHIPSLDRSELLLDAQY